MTEKMQAKILEALSVSGMPDYAFLSSKAVRKIYPVLLKELLKKAESTFEDLLKTPGDKCDFSSVVERYLYQDEELSHLFSFLNNLNHTDASPDLRRMIEDFQPLIVTYQNFVSTHPQYYSMLHKVAEAHKDSGQKARVMELLIRDMEYAGVHLKGKKKARLQAINIELSTLSECFQNNVLDDRKRFFQHFPDDTDLKEMPPEILEMGRQDAALRKKQGFIFTLSPPSHQAVMKFCTNRDIRKKFWLKHCQIATHGKFDNRENVLKILQLRHEKAQIMGYKNYAEYALTRRMAKNTDEVFRMTEEFTEKASKKAQGELKELIGFSGVKDITHWDLPYYSEKMLHQKLNINEQALKPYFPLEATLSGMFQIAEKLFGIHLKPLNDPSYNPDVRTFEVFAGKQKIAYFIFDPFARPEKQGGAWCNEFRARKLLPKGEYRLPVVINVANFAKGSKNAPTLLTHDNVQVVFHEFGHAMHLILGKTDYPNLSGFNTEWDFVELPSQIFENWTWEEESLALFAYHHKTGKKIPAKLLNALNRSRTFLKGIFLLRQTEFGLLDFTLHTEPPPTTSNELDELCLRLANTHAVIKKPPQYKMYASFSHIFSGGYAAGYYSYLWAEILEADAFERFQEEGILNPITGHEFRDKLLAPGASKDGYELFDEFVGHPPSPAALLKKLGIEDRE